MKIELPDIPYELLDTLSSAEVLLVEAYARQAIREFVEGLKVVGFVERTEFGYYRQGGPLASVDMSDTARFLDDIRLIIKPEIDDVIQ